MSKASNQQPVPVERQVIRQRIRRGITSAVVAVWVSIVAFFYLLQYVQAVCLLLRIPFGLCSP